MKFPPPLFFFKSNLTFSRKRVFFLQNLANFRECYVEYSSQRSNNGEKHTKIIPCTPISKFRMQALFGFRRNTCLGMSRKYLTMATSRNLKREIWSLFAPCINAMGRQPYCPSCMEGSYCTFGLGAIIRRDLRTLLLLRDSPRDNQYACVIWVYAGKATHA